jgi:O-antigen chain-terminating methyltransferase
VQNAYLVLLKRDADVEGLTGRLQRLRTGEVSRVELLFRLRYGPEGKEHKTRVSGLLRAFILERVCRVPVIGLIPGYLRALLSLPRMQRDIEEIRGLIAMQDNNSNDRDRAIVDFQNEKFDKIMRRL